MIRQIEAELNGDDYDWFVKEILTLSQLKADVICPLDGI